MKGLSGTATILAVALVSVGLSTTVVAQDDAADQQTFERQERRQEMREQRRQRFEQRREDFSNLSDEEIAARREDARARMEERRQQVQQRREEIDRKTESMIDAGCWPIEVWAESFFLEHQLFQLACELFKLLVFFVR